MLNYETKPKEALQALKLPVTTPRQEGIAIVDVDPESPTFGQILMDMPLPPDVVAHHIFYNRDSSKAYVTALAKPELRVIDMQANPYRMKTVSVPDCMVGEDVVFSDDNSTWYLTCMGSGVVVVGDVATDEIKQVIKSPKPYPHGIAIHNGIDRVLISNTVRHTDLQDPGNEIVEIEASTGKVLDTYPVAAGKSGTAPVEILFVPESDPPVAYVTNMYGGSLSTATWNPDKGKFDVQEVHDFTKDGAGVPLELYFSPNADRLYVTTAKPGHLHIFDLSAGPGKPKLTKTIAAGEGAHHVAFTQDWKYGFVQNSLLNLPGMSDGSITVVDLEKEEVIGSIDTFKKTGRNPNSIVLLPEWNHLAGH